MANLKNAITLERLIEATHKNFDGTIQVLDTVNPKNVHTKVEIMCNACGDNYLKRVNDLLHGYGCRSCNGTGVVLKKFRTTESLQLEVHDNTFGEYQFTGVYTTTRDKATFFHTLCGTEFEMKVHNFVTLGQRCPYCKVYNRGRSSNAVTTILQVLDQLNLNYVTEKKFKGLISGVKSGGLLSFDIYVESLNLLIEYDGEQHFRPVTIFGGEKWFESCKANDLKKDQWAKENGIQLIRFNYKQKSNIKQIALQTLTNVQRLSKG